MKLLMWMMSRLLERSREAVCDFHHRGNKGRLFDALFGQVLELGRNDWSIFNVNSFFLALIATE